MTNALSTRLLAGGGVTALALALLTPAAGHAQSAIQATPTNVSPGTFVNQTQLIDTITVTTPEAIIDWQVNNPLPGNYVLLPQGRTARFVGFAPFTILNRILPQFSGTPVSRLIELNGTITSEIDLSNQNGGIVRGGSVWFYSAGGILVGPQAVINVGSLVLTSNAITTTGGLFGPTGDIRFAGDPASGPVTIAAGAAISATDPANPGSSYVALVAPRVVQAGTVFADGSTALVAAEVANIRINAGLFDIDVITGTDDANGVVHSGATGGPLDTSPANASRVYMVAVPRNTAIEMLLSGTVGYQTLGASVNDGSIVISAGRNVAGGLPAPLPTGPGIPANVRLGDLLSFNGIDVFAEGDISVGSATTACNGCRIFDINGSANLFATNAVRMTAGRGQEIRVAGDLNLRADNQGQGGVASITADRSGPGAGNAALPGGIVTVFGNLRVDAVGLGGATLNGAGQGGTASLLADGGRFVANDIFVDASGIGDRTNGNGADGTGGNAAMITRNGGDIRARSADVRADGTGGGIRIDPATGLELAADIGGNGTGGTALVRAETGGVIVLQDLVGGPAPLTVSASGVGSAGAIDDGDGRGGQRAAVEIADPASSITASLVDIRAFGVGGFNLARNLILTGVIGGDGTGGLAELVLGGQLLTTTIAIDATGTGSSVAANPQIPNAGNPLAGDGTGGTARMVVNGVNGAFAEVGLTAEGYGGNAAGDTSRGGDGRGGQVALVLNDAANLQVADRVFAFAFGGGGAGESQSGDGTGGSALVDLAGAAATLRSGRLQVHAHAVGGGATSGGPMGGGLPTPDGGDGRGGTAEVRATGLIDVTGAIELLASGTGGRAVAIPANPAAPQGGDGTGGNARLTAAGGTIQNGGAVLLNAAGTATSTQGGSGVAQGGNAALSASGNGRVVSTGTITLLATAESNANGGTGGIIDIAATDSSQILLAGAPGLGASASALAVNGTGGTVRLRTAGSARLVLPPTILTASSTTAGRIAIDAGGPGAMTFQSLTANALGPLVNAASGIVVANTSGAGAVVTNGATLDSDGDIVLASADGGALVVNAGGLTMRTRRSIRGTQNVAGSPIAQSPAITMTAGADIRFGPNARLVSTGALQMDAVGSIVIDNALATGLLRANASAIDLNAMQSGTLALTATGLVRLGTGLALGDAAITGSDITIGALTTQSGANDADIMLTATGTTALGTLNAQGNVAVTTGTLTGGASAVTATGSITSASTGASEFGSLTGATGVFVTSGASLTGQSASSAGGAVSLTAAGAVRIDAVTAGGAATLRSTTAQITAGTVASTGTATLTAATTLAAARLSSTGGAIDARGGTGASIGTANAAGSIDILGGTGTAALTTGISGGTTRISGNAVTVGSATTSGTAADIVITADQNVTLGALTAGRDINILAATLGGTTSTLTAGRALSAALSGNASLGSAQAGGALSITSGGTLTAGTVRSTGGSASLAGAGGATIAAVQSAGTTSLSALNGALAVAELQSVGAISATARSIGITTRGGATFATLAATTGDARVTAATGGLFVNSGNAGGTLALTTTAGDLTTGALTGSTVTLTSSALATLNGTTAATGALTVDARGTAAINAVATGSTVAVRSGNIAIGTSGRLGTAGTTTSLLLANNDAASRTFIGGSDVTTGYSLSAAEMLRLFGSDITINAPRAQTQGGGTLGSNRPPDVIIGAFTLQGGVGTAGNLSANGTLTIATPGSARVTGAVVLDGMTAANRFLLSATEAIEVIAGQGSVRMSNGGVLSGVIELRSDDIAVATSAAIAAIAGLTDLNAIDDRLGENDGVASDDGMLAAGGIRMTARGGVYIQNSGTGTRFADRRGFTTGAGGLSITTAGPATRIVINGRILNATGSFATGRDTIPFIMIGIGIDTNPSRPVTSVTGQAFDPGSTVNGCLIANPAACIEGDGIPPVQDIIDVTETIGDGTIDARLGLLIELRDLEPLPNEPLIDDPVTGTGNDDLWEAPCEPAEGEEACP